jgi:hypothetical protein
MQNIHLELEKYDNWLAEHFEELVTKYPKKSIAVVNDEIIAIGNDEKELDRMAREKYPEAVPFIFTVPSEEDLTCLL